MEKKLTMSIIKELLKKYTFNDSDKNKIELNKDLLNTFFNSYNKNKAVLGIDIYRYSQYATLPQTLIPYLFKILYEQTIENCIILEPYIFKKQKKIDFRNSFIETGDGGFQIFDNPFQAIIFSIYFQANVSRYNSIHNSTQDLFNLIDEITLRYSLTYDSVYSFEKNFYGAAIINCSRIMSKDKLNRFLIDGNTKKWFTKEFNGIENLQILDIEKDCEEIECLKQPSKKTEIKSVIFKDSLCKILSVDNMKIGEIKSKMDILSIYNLHIQIKLYSVSSRIKKITVTLGNLNSNGLID